MFVRHAEYASIPELANLLHQGNDDFFNDGPLTECDHRLCQGMF